MKLSELDDYDYIEHAYSPELMLHAISVSSDSKIYSMILTSSDGINWTERMVSDGETWIKSIAWSKENGLFVAISTNNDFRNHIFTSSDGILWEKTIIPTGHRLKGIIWDKICGFIVHQFGTDKIMVSRDAITWKEV